MVLGDRLAVGASADIYAFEPGRVVKLFRPEYAYIAEDEAERTRAVHAAGLPCPGVHGVVTIDGRRGIVLDRHDGPTLLAGMGNTEDGRAEAAGELAELHRQLHRASPPQLPSWQDVVARITATLDDAGRQGYESVLRGVRDGQRTYHGDMHPGNVILAAGGPIVVDWPNACLAHPGADVARSLVLIRYQGLTAKTDPAIRSTRRQFADAYLTAYLAGDGVDAAAVASFLPLHAHGLLRGDPGNACAEELRALLAGKEDPVLAALRR